MTTENTSTMYNTSGLLLFTYDIETFKNLFSFTGKFLGDPRIYKFEISARKNQMSELLSFLSYLENARATMVGYNSLGFDWPIVQNLIQNVHTFTYTTAYNLCQQIITAQDGYFSRNQFNFVKAGDRTIPQIDLMKINHFDNVNKRTPLKSLQFAMRLDSIEDSPVGFGYDLNDAEMDMVLAYNEHDVLSTEQFLIKCLHLIALRKELLDNGVLTGDVLNYSDVKLGTEYLVKKIGRAKCYSGSVPNQTIRESVVFKDIILPKIEFRTEPFQAVLDWFKQQTIWVNSEEEKPSLSARLAGLDFDFGVGGVHASVKNRVFVSNETHVIKDIDVTGMYVSVAIANGFFPAHLGREFSDAYKQLQTDRAQYKKGSSMNAVLKLAGNGVFGNSDNKYSCFYDPNYPKAVTVNGQLQILQLVEVLSLIPGVDIIQANTDGITVYLPRQLESYFNLWKSDWESGTGLVLEQVTYSKMWIRDVNNYLCLLESGKIKAKGAYWFPKDIKDYDGVWNKDFSMMIVQKVIEQTLVNDLNPEWLLQVATNPFDFMIRYKVNAGAKVYLGEREMPKTIRYYVSTRGEKMKKIAVPKGKTIGDYKRKNSLSDPYFNKILSEIPEGSWDERIHTANKKKYEAVTTNIENGRFVKECNDISKFDPSDIDFEYYLNEINKLYIGASNG